MPQYHFVQRPRRRGLTLNDLIVFGMLCLFSPLLFAVTIYALGAVAIMAPFLFMPCLAACILVGRRPGDDARAWSARLGFLGAGLAALAPVGVKLMLSM